MSNVNVLGDKDVVAIAAKHHVTPAQVALRWVVQQGVLFATAATNPTYLREDLDVFGFELSGAEMAALSAKQGRQTPA